MIPNSSPAFDRIIDVDHIGSEWACCNTVNKKPFLEYEGCGMFWWQGGFHALNYDDEFATTAEEENKTGTTKQKELTVAEAHTMLHSYPLVRLNQGTGVVFAGLESGRMCRPQFGTCTR